MEQLFQRDAIIRQSQVTTLTFLLMPINSYDLTIRRGTNTFNTIHVFLMVIFVVVAHCCLLVVLCYSWSLIGWRALQKIRLEIFLTTLNTMPKMSAGEFASGKTPDFKMSPSYKGVL